MWLGLFQYIHSTPSFPAAILMMQLPHNISNFRFSTLYFPPDTLICLDFLVKKGHHCFSIFCIQNCLESFATVLSFTSYQRMQAFNTNNMDYRLQWKYCDIAKFDYNYNREVGLEGIFIFLLMVHDEFLAMFFIFFLNKIFWNILKCNHQFQQLKSQIVILYKLVQSI